MHDPHSPPRVSVVLPVFNAGRYVAEALDSILGQTLRDCEYIVIDDGSTDGTPTILAGRAALDPRIRLVSRPNRGLTRTLNEGIGLALAGYVAIMNADDIALPTRLEKQAAFLDEHPQVAAVGTATVTFADQGTKKVVAVMPVDSAALQSLLTSTSPFAHPTVMFRRQAVCDTGLYRPQLEPAEDYDLWLRLAERFEVANLSEPLLEYRLHAGQSTAFSFERVAIAALVAQASARARVAGMPDPAEGRAVIDRDLAATLGITDSQIARFAIENALSRGECLVTTGAPATDCMQPLAALRAHTVAAREPGLFAGADRWLRARLLVREGRWPRAIPLFAGAAGADAAFRRRLVWAIGRRTAGG